MRLTSPAFEPGGTIPKQYTCQGKNVNPPLVIADVPAEAKSLVLVMTDPDAPRETFVHWTVWNIDPAVTEIVEDSVPVGAVEGATGSGKPGYVGPCPPKGEHRYFFLVVALDTILDQPPTATDDQLQIAASGHILERAELMGRYQKHWFA